MMCATCGCSNHRHLHGRGHSPVRRDGEIRYRALAASGMHAHGHGHSNEHAHHDGHEHLVGSAHNRNAEYAQLDFHARAHGTTIALEQEVLAKNDALAERNRAWLAARGILALNLVSSPGSGKTTLLVRTIADLAGTLRLSVLGGDQATRNDAERIAATGCEVLQVNTGTGCHLDAAMVARALRALAPRRGSVVMIENVGNLVCPALFDLGERAKVVMLSVTEGEDKPLKYPHMFRAARVMLLTKIDLLPHLEFDVDACIANARRVNPAIEVMQVSSRSGAGLDAWYGWLRAQHATLPEPAHV